MPARQTYSPTYGLKAHRRSFISDGVMVLVDDNGEMALECCA